MRLFAPLSLPVSLCEDFLAVLWAGCPVCSSGDCLALFGRSRGSELIIWTSSLPHPQRKKNTTCLFLYILLRILSADSPTDVSPFLIMNKNRPQLFSHGLRGSSRGGHQKNGESDSWSSSWPAPLIRSEWQENMGPYRYSISPWHPLFCFHMASGRLKHSYISILLSQFKLSFKSSLWTDSHQSNHFFLNCIQLSAFASFCLI